jgi:DNA-binding transcriptional LysR family regulator
MDALLAAWVSCIVLMTIMRLTHLRQVDLNLLVVFTALAEERSVTRAAKRLLLSQPALSRALQRLRETFHDDLLVRSPDGYQPTPRGQRLLDELSTLLPRIDRMLSGAVFDPATEPAAFRIAATDSGTQIFCPPIARLVLPYAKSVSVQFVVLDAESYQALERGRFDLMITVDDGQAPERLHREELLRDEFVCVVAKENRAAGELSLKQYLDASHIRVAAWGPRLTIPEQRLAALGHQRVVALEVPYFSAALQSVAGTGFVATVPKRLALLHRHNPAVKILKAPAALKSFRQLMIWHPRLDADAAHSWLRAVVRKAAETLQA